MAESNVEREQEKARDTPVAPTRKPVTLATDMFVSLRVVVASVCKYLAIGWLPFGWYRVRSSQTS